MSMLDDVRFWAQVYEDSRRTLIVPPDLESRAVETVKARGLEGIVTVRVSRWLPAGMVFLIDEQAIEADWRHTMQQCSIRPML
ncbi:hypothetical protein GCM10027059_26670 [Myceligenerans halotolerans]